MYSEKRQAFTFVEILLALSILAVGIMAFIALINVGVNSARRAENITKAALLGQYTLEECKKLGINSSLYDFNAGVKTVTEAELASFGIDNPYGDGFERVLYIDYSLQYKEWYQTSVGIDCPDDTVNEGSPYDLLRYGILGSDGGSGPYLYRLRLKIIYPGPEPEERRTQVFVTYVGRFINE